jgi:hypothetical protein
MLMMRFSRGCKKQKQTGRLNGILFVLILISFSVPEPSHQEEKADQGRKASEQVQRGERAARRFDREVCYGG